MFQPFYVQSTNTWGQIPQGRYRIIAIIPETVVNVSVGGSASSDSGGYKLIGVQVDNMNSQLQTLSPTEVTFDSFVDGCLVCQSPKPEESQG